jgi:hypothetical protein
MVRQERTMSQLKDERHQDDATPARGKTVTAQGENQAPKARQPNERDESADSQAADSAAIRQMGELAHGSAAQGQQDTSKGQELDATYHRVRQESPPAPVAPRNKRQRAV